VAKRQCLYCKCTDAAGCAGGCYWVLPNVCSRCAGDQLRDAGLSAEWIQIPREVTAGLLTAAILAETLCTELLASVDLNPTRFTPQVVNRILRVAPVLEDVLNLYDDTAAAGFIPSRDDLIVEAAAADELPAAPPPPEILIANVEQARELGIEIGGGT
jgi:hypothetical protein